MLPTFPPTGIVSCSRALAQSRSSRLVDDATIVADWQGMPGKDENCYSAMRRAPVTMPQSNRDLTVL
jgi:hypothetical protein